MVAPLEELQDASEFGESYCASLAASSAPGCQLVEVFNSHGIFLPQLADEAGLSGMLPPASCQLHPHTAPWSISDQLHASGAHMLGGSLVRGASVPSSCEWAIMPWQLCLL